MTNLKALADSDINRIVEMFWEDRTTFDAIESQFRISEQEVKRLMRGNLKPSSYKLLKKSKRKKNKAFD